MKLLFLVCFFFLSFKALGQPDSTASNKKEKIIFASGTSAFYGISVLGMNELWYKNYEHSAFHWIDDSGEWLQVDKTGHFFSSYIATRFLFGGLKSIGINNNKSLLYASGISLLGISTIEVFDGFSAGWGASASDLLANSAGVALFALQTRLWNEEKIIPKISWHPTKFASYRPDVLGGSLAERMLKDYNGHTLWLSFNLASLTGSELFPGWLCFSLGYGAEGMTSGYDSPATLPYFRRYRQYYLSFDADLNRIKTSSKTLHKIFQTLNLLKIPFPALEFSPGDVNLRGFYF